MLNSQYFLTVDSRTDNGFEYTIVIPKDSPLILFSKVDGLPIASIHLKCQTGSKSLFTKRPYESSIKCDFQGIINKEGQEFEFVITNLCADGMINFNILKQDIKVDQVNPGGLNEVNELRPFESYAVKCDQANNKTMILNAITNASTGEKVTVNEDELSGTPQGTYFFLSVVPQIDKKE